MVMKQKQQRPPKIPTASMGDIAFLIIIFFMVTTVFTRDKGLKMLLPEKTEKEDIVKIKPENIVMIAINPLGEIKVKAGGEDIDLAVQEYDQIKEIVESRLRQRDTLLVVSIRTSKDASYKNMIAVLDQLKLAKVTTTDGRELRANKISLVPTSEAQ